MDDAWIRPWRSFELNEAVEGNTNKKLRQINNYLLCCKLGSGSASKVYLGVDCVTKKQFAVKRIALNVVYRTSGGVEQLEREVRLLRLFDHPNIVKLQEVLRVRAKQEVYVVIQYADNGSLADVVKRQIRLPDQAIFSVMKQVASAISYVHKRGFVHQDIKPSNILMGKEGRAFLADFGVGHTFGSAAMIVGTPAYQAPEVLSEVYEEEEEKGETATWTEGSREVEPEKEDAWALGVTLFELLFLRLPFVGENLYEIVRSIKEDELEIPTGTDPRIVELLKGMLNVDPSKRMGIDEVLANELIAEAPDLAESVPILPPVEIKQGEVSCFEGKVCGVGHSFARRMTLVQTQLARFHAPYRTMGSITGTPGTGDRDCGEYVPGSAPVSTGTMKYGAFH